MGYLRFVYAVLALLIGWMLGHRRGFDRGIAHAGRLVHAHGGSARSSPTMGVPVAGETIIRGRPPIEEREFTRDRMDSNAEIAARIGFAHRTRGSG